MAFTNKQREPAVDVTPAGRIEWDPAKLAVVDQYDGRDCPDGIRRNRWGCRFCSVEGCGIVSDVVIGGQELCTYHSMVRTARADAEMTETLQQYRPLKLLVDEYEHTSPFLEEERAKLFEAFRILVKVSGFNVYQVSTSETVRDIDGREVIRRKLVEHVVDLPVSKAEADEERHFVSPGQYFRTVASKRAIALAEIRRLNFRTTEKTVERKTRADKILERVRLLGETWKQKFPTGPAALPAADPDEYEGVW